MKNKSVKIVVTVPAADMKRLQAHVRPLGIDAIEIVTHHLNDVGNLVDNLVSDHEVLCCGYTFPSRRAAQRMVTERFKGTRSGRPYHFMEVSFMEAGKAHYERLYAPGAKQAEKKLANVCRVWTEAKRRHDVAARAANRFAGYLAS